MSGIVGSKLNIRGSGRIAKLGTDGQVLTSSGAGVAANYEDAAGGGLDWQSVETGATFTAVAGNGYPVNTTAQACTVTLPASASVGDEIIFTDYARNFATYNLTINQNSLNYQGNSTPNPIYDTAGESIHIVYVDATQGWVPTYDGAVALETAQTYDCEYLIVAGGGGGGYRGEPSGGGGAGGYRTNYGGTAIALTPGTAYSVTVGTGGAGSSSLSDDGGANGVDSTLTGSDITNLSATGGGGGSGGSLVTGGHDGGSGGGGHYGGSSPGADGGDGNTGGNGGDPSIPEGYDGGDGIDAGSPSFGGGGGGGSAAAGINGSTSSGGCGGTGTSNSITGSALYYAAGGGSGASSGGAVCASTNSIGGVGAIASTSASTAGTNGTGSGGGSGDSRGSYNAADGGDGVVILRMATADYSGTTTGSPTITTDGSDTIIKFTATTGSYTG